MNIEDYVYESMSEAVYFEESSNHIRKVHKKKTGSCRMAGAGTVILVVTAINCIG